MRIVNVTTVVTTLVITRVITLAFWSVCVKIHHMDPESKQVLANILEISEENNKMLHKIRGVQKKEAIWSTLKFLAIMAVAFGSFYFLEPYFDKIMQVYQSFGDMQEKINESPLKNLF